MCLMTALEGVACRRLESQLQQAQLMLSETRSEHLAVRRQHAELLGRSMKESEEAAAARLAARSRERDLQRQLAAAQADTREARAEAAAALADGTARLEQDVQSLRRCAATAAVVVHAADALDELCILRLAALRPPCSARLSADGREERACTRTPLHTRITPLCMCLHQHRIGRRALSGSQSISLSVYL